MILLRTQMWDGCRHWATVRKWPTKFRPYAPRFKPRIGKCKVSTLPFHKPRPPPSPESIQEEKAQVDFKKDPIATKWKHRIISAVWDFPTVPGRYNPYLKKEMKREMHPPSALDCGQVRPDGVRSDPTIEDKRSARLIQPIGSRFPLQH